MLASEEPPPTARTPLSGKRFRPPVLDITQAVERRPSIQIETGPTPVKLRPTDDDDDDSSDDDDVFEDTLQLSSPESLHGSRRSSAVFKGGHIATASMDADEIERELARLKELRQNLKKNLEVRPIRSRSNLKIDLAMDHDAVPLPPFPSAPRSNTLPNPPDSSGSTSSWTTDNPPESALSSYFTPLSEIPRQQLLPPGLSVIPPIDEDPAPRGSHNGAVVEPPPSTAYPISAKALYDRLKAVRQPLLIDARPLAAHEAFHIRSSINIAIPSLILKRCKKPGGGFPTLNALRQYITTEHGKVIWDDLTGGQLGDESLWDGDVVIYDDDMNVNDKSNIAWAMIPVIAPLLSYGTVDYLEGGISSAGHDPDLQTLVLTGDEAANPEHPLSWKAQAPLAPQRNNTRKASVGLFQLDTQTTYRGRQLPEIEPSSTVSTQPSSPLPPMPSPLPVLPAVSSSTSSSRTTSTKTSPALSELNGHITITDSSPSPPPSSLAGFRRPPPPRRPSAPNLRKIDTKSMERINTNVPKLSLRTKLRSATVGGPSGLQATSPGPLKLHFSTHSPIYGPASAYPAESRPTPFFTPPHSPGTPKAMFNFSVTDVQSSGHNNTFSQHRQQHHGLAPPRLPDPPPTARPDGGFDFNAPPTTSEEEDAFPTFTVSTILPNFLFLGPELTNPEHVDELKSLGVKRILNIAAECDDDQGLGLREVFDKYLRIPMRDTVEEDNITRGVREACDFLDDARLHSSPTYVHCKAGKSRSVTAVMAYLIHANRWTLSRAYAFVLERRKGISPNIGFVSELMNFEEQELGNKSVGVQPSAPVVSGSMDMQDGFAAAVSSGNSAANSAGMGSGGLRSHHGLVRSRTHVRDSLPPTMETGGRTGEPMSAGGMLDRVIHDSGQEVEIKDASGRYRHARRAPVNESTLQPMRRVSKAGLESFAIEG